MSIEPGKTYRMRPQKVNGVYRDDRVFRVDEVLQDGLVVKGGISRPPPVSIRILGVSTFSRTMLH
jgi:hypothetical protein